MLRTFLVTAAAASSLSSICGDSAKEVEKFEADKNFGEIEVKSKSDNCRSKVKFELKLRGDGPEVRLDVDERQKEGEKDDKTETKAKFHMRAKVLRVVEFVDANNNNVVDDDEAIQTVKVGTSKNDELDWSDVMKSKTDDGVMCLHATAGDWFTVSAHYSAKPVQFTNNGTSYMLDPNAIKLDYIIKNWPYAGNSSKLALDGRFKSKAKFHSAAKKKKTKEEAKEQKGDEEEFDIKDDGATNYAKFSWVTTVDADGEEVPVVGTKMVESDADDEDDKPTDGEKNYKITWVFDKVGKVNTFTWDPTVTSVSEDSEASGASFVSSALSLVATACLFVF